MKKVIIHYLYGLFAASWNGGIATVAGILGIDGAAITGAAPDARVLNLHEMLAAFGGAFVLNAVFWLKAHPLPDDIATTHPFPPKTPSQ